MNIPADLLLPHIRAYVDARGISIEDFEASMGYTRGAVSGRVERYGDFSFNMTDRIFCKLGNPLGYWLSEEFQPYYDAEFERTCVECSVVFAPMSPKQKYCSQRCRQARHRGRQQAREEKLAADRARLAQANRERALRAKEKPAKTEEEREYRRLRNRVNKRAWRQRQREAVAA